MQKPIQTHWKTLKSIYKYAKKSGVRRRQPDWVVAEGDHAWKDMQQNTTQTGVLFEVCEHGIELAQ